MPGRALNVSPSLGRGNGSSTRAAALETAPLLKVQVEDPWDPRIRAAPKQSFLQRALSSCLSQSAAKVALAAIIACAWMFVSSLLILVNKTILKDLKFPYPMTVSSMGMATSGCFSWALCRLFRLVEAKASVSWHYYLTRMLPVGFFMALTLWTGNLVYLYLTVSFIQMLKALTPVITMLALFLARLETPSRRLIGSVVGIAGGTALAAYGEINLSVVGVAVMLVSEAAESARLVMTQFLLQGLKMGPFEGVMYLAPACFVWLTFGALCIEWRAIHASQAHTIPQQNPGIFALAACMGFAVNVLAYATIKLAGSLTLKVLGTVKNALLIVVAMLLYGEVVTLLQAVGYAISTGAFGVYTMLKMQQIASGS